MGALTIGRVGLDIDMDHPAAWSESRGLEERDFTVTGFLRAATVEESMELRSELLEQQGQLVAVTYTLDPQFDGFYILGDVRVETVVTSYLYRGLFPYEIGLFRIGGQGRVELQSNVTGTVLTNDHGLLSSEVTPWIAPPTGHQAFQWDATGATALVTRATEDGNVIVFSSNGDFSQDASWGANPNTYYSGAAELWVGDPLRLRAGLDVPHEPDEWSIDNGLIRVSGENGNTGRIDVEVYGGSAWESLKDIAFDVSGTVNGWQYMTVSRNTPECVILRLMAGGAGTARNVLDLQIRRGAMFVIGTWTKTGALATMKVVNDGVLAATAITPTGATGNVGVRATSNDADGNRLFIYTPQTHTNDTANCGVSVASTRQIRFAIGYELNGSSAAAGNTAAECALQYFAYFGERVRAVWR